MAYYVYILKSLRDQSYYKGFTENPIIRLEQHNNAESKYTRSKIPWKLVYLEYFESKKDALVRERHLKKYSHQQIEQLISSRLNGISEVGDFDSAG